MNLSISLYIRAICIIYYVTVQATWPSCFLRTPTSPTALTLEGILIPWSAFLFTGVYSSDFFMAWDCLKVEEVEKLEISRPSSLKG